MNSGTRGGAGGGKNVLISGRSAVRESVRRERRELLAFPDNWGQG